MTVARGTIAVATLLVGLSAGFFFTYQVSVTRGLAEVDDIAYVTTFQAINDTVRNAWFAVVFFGSVPAIAAAAVANWRGGGARRWLVCGALPLYVAGLAVTATKNVPLNDELAEARPIPAAAAKARTDFEDDWNRFNLVRTMAIGASFATLVAAGGIRSATPARRTPWPPEPAGGAVAGSDAR